MRPRAALVLFALLSGCGVPDVPPEPPAPATKGEPAAELTGEVVQAADGNVLLIRPKGARRDVLIRLIGSDAPRKATRDLDGQEPWGTRSQQFLALLCVRKAVRVEFDVVVPASEDGKTRWGYVWLGDKLLNEEVLRAGHAVLDTRPPNVKHVERLQAAQKDAREAGRGVWDSDEPLPEPPGKFAAKRQADADSRQEIEDAVALPAWAAGCVIGNKDSKKYHKPGGRYYEAAKTSRHAVFFKDAADAEKAGYEASAR